MTVRQTDGGDCNMEILTKTRGPEGPEALT